MHRFTAKYADRLAGVLSGFDRLLFRGTLRRLSYVTGLQICLTGREWLARQLAATGLQYVRHDNCFSRVENFAKAQALLDAQLHTDWPTLLGDLALRVNPLWEELFGDSCPSYYWTTAQSE